MSNKYQAPGGDDEKKPLHGEPPDKELMHGPVTNRGCTDCLCFLIYVACTVFMIYIISIGFKKGQPLRLTYPYDPDGNACGYDLKVKNSPYIYLVAPYPKFFNRSVCLSQCPNWPENAESVKVLACSPNSVIPNCTGKVANNNDTSEKDKDILNFNFQDQNVNAYMNYSIFIYNSSQFLDRVCLPDGEKYVDLIYEYVNPTDFINVPYFSKWVDDVSVAWPVIAISAALALIIGMVYMCCMRLFSGILTWIGIILYFVALGLLIAFLNTEATSYENQVNYEKTNNQPYDEDQKTMYALRYLSYALIAVFILSIVAFICYFNRIRLAIAVIKTASLYVMEVPFSLMVPPFIAIFLVIFWLLWIYSFIYVYSVGDIKGRSDSPFATITWDETTRRMLYFHLFMALWNNALILAICQFVLASSCCIWYFSKGPGQSFFQFPLLVSFKRAVTNHVGSLQVGSFILAVVQFIRLWLEYINYQMKQVSNNNPPQPAKCFLDCCRCYSAYFERFISFLNKNAYIQIALTAKSFIPAAKDGFYLVWSNAGKFAVVNGIGAIFTTIGKLFVSLISTYVCYIILTKSEHFKDKIFSPFLPLLFCFVVSYFIAELFMNVYGMAIDSVLQCSIVDEDICKREGKPPQYCPEPLKDFYKSIEK